MGRGLHRSAHLETTTRATRIKAEANKMDVEIKGIFWTSGLFKDLLVFLTPDDETATAILLKLGARGSVKTSTARAYTAIEIDQLMEHAII